MVVVLSTFVVGGSGKPNTTPKEFLHVNPARLANSSIIIANKPGSSGSIPFSFVYWKNVPTLIKGRNSNPFNASRNVTLPNRTC